MADNLKLSTIETYTFGRSGGQNIINGDIVFIPLTSTQIISSNNNTPNDFIGYLNNSEFEVASAEILQVVLTSEQNGKITIDNIDYQINNCTVSLPISTFDSEIESALTDIVLNGIWVKRNDVNSNFFQLQSQIGALQNEAAVLTEQLNRANSYVSAIMAKNSKYLIGDYYITESKENPAIRFGGEWELVKNQILSGVPSEATDFKSDNGDNEYVSRKYGSGLTITFDMGSFETLPPHYHNTPATSVTEDKPKHYYW
jgi:archaellum component FlaF (FlaF/FlaG flagellin family)